MKLIFILRASLFQSVGFIYVYVSLFAPSIGLFLCSHIRECLRLDQDDKECFSHYKQVKKLSKQLDVAEELIQMERSVGSVHFSLLNRDPLRASNVYLQIK